MNRAGTRRAATAACTASLSPKSTDPESLTENSHPPALEKSGAGVRFFDYIILLIFNIYDIIY